MAAKKRRTAQQTRRHAQQQRRAARQDKQAAKRRNPPQGRRVVTNAESLQRLCSWFLPNDGIFASIKLHGNTKWLPRCLVWLALCWALVDARHLTDAFDHALDVCSSLFPCTLTTYQGFMAALLSVSARLIPLLRDVLHQRMQQINSPYWCIAGWVPIAFDGSRSTAPRTQANETAFCASNYGKGKTARYRKKKSKGMRRKRNVQNKAQPQQPQAWITLLWHMGLRLPWTWRLGPSNSSERGHVMEMIEKESFPSDTLFCGDAGFVGYPLWSCLAKRHHFLVRVGANVKLLSEQADFVLQTQGENECSVLCWPKEAIRSKTPPLRLRLLRIQVGKTWMWLLTNVLDEQQLTAQAASRFYQLRWGVELEFRGLKQTLDRAELRSRNDKRLLVELDWSILAMAMVELLALHEQQQQRTQENQPPANPAKRSLANAVRALRKCLRKLHETPPPGEGLTELLRAAVTDDYQRTSSKRSRYKRPNPDKKPLGDPNVRSMNPEERRKLQELDAATAP